MSRGTADAAVGMMDGAYFVGRKELLDFFNNLLDLEYTKIEQTASGAMACQLTSLIFPGSVPLSKINWDAKSDYEFVQNYKLLQNAFNKHKVQRYVDVDKLIRAKYQDNLEFCQWLKAFYDQSGAVRSELYDPAAARAKGKGGTRFNAQFGRKSNGMRKGGSGTVRHGGGGGGLTTGAVRSNAAPKKTNAPSSGFTTGTASASSRPSRPLRDRDVTNTHKSTSTDSGGPDAATLAAMETLESKNQELTLRVSDLEESLVALEEERDMAVLEIEKERDFYFTKLRDVEVLLQIYQEKGSSSSNGGENDGDGMPTALLDDVFKILYATAEEELTVTEHGTVHVAAPGEVAAAAAVDDADGLEDGFAEGM